VLPEQAVPSLSRAGLAALAMLLVAAVFLVHLRRA
jgi:hypothetical protein